jgi:flavin-dependent dehydrogenase
MSFPPSTYEVAIVGGGLAGLSLSISLARRGIGVILFERHDYPFHRVCGEYISMESWPYLESLGISKEGLPGIHQLLVSAPDGYTLTHSLEPGGFGISRYVLDQQLAQKAIEAGVCLKTGSKIQDISFQNDRFILNTNVEHYSATVVVGSFGKRSNLDVKMERSFVKKRNEKSNLYVGVKYHIRYPQPKGQIALHNFPDGYCGLSEVDGDKQCLCYLTTAANLALSGNNIAVLEKNILSINPYLRGIFREATFLWDKPQTIAQISFERKNPVEDHVLMTGDSAGMISPLCGNGMSIALHSGLLAGQVIIPFLDGKLDRKSMESSYRDLWNAQFSGRLRVGRMIQSLFGSPYTTKLFLKVLQPFPKFTKRIIQSTHGNPF